MRKCLYILQIFLGLALLLIGIALIGVGIGTYVWIGNEIKSKYQNRSSAPDYLYNSYQPLIKPIFGNDVYFRVRLAHTLEFYVERKTFNNQLMNDNVFWIRSHYEDDKPMFGLIKIVAPGKAAPGTFYSVLIFKIHSDFLY